VYFWFKTKRNQEAGSHIVSSKEKTLNGPIVLEFNKQDLFNASDVDDLLSDLIEKYYPDFDDSNFHQLDSVARTFVLIVNLDGQVQNGGLIQFIDNSTGNYFHETIEAAKKIGNEKLVEILTKITAQYPEKQIPKDWSERRDLWDVMCEDHENDAQWDKLWEDLDDQYYNNADLMNQQLIDYLKANAKIK
jgi:hypothetical protein